MLRTGIPATMFIAGRMFPDTRSGRSRLCRCIARKFMVDPNFLSYTATRIEISAVVRRDPANDPANLNLEYESPSGYKKPGAHHIPADRKWHTAKWTIEDAQFVSKWAFNFRFDSGSYYIRRVTVTKCGAGVHACD